MSKTKRIMSIMLVIIIAIGISGCGNKNGKGLVPNKNATNLLVTFPTTASATTSSATATTTVPHMTETTQIEATAYELATQPTTVKPLAKTKHSTTETDDFDSETTMPTKVATTLAMEVTSEDEVPYVEEPYDNDSLTTTSPNIKEYEDSDYKEESNHGTYIKVNIATQTLRYYKEGELVLESSVVTGTEGSTPTPTGEFWVNNKAQNIDLIGDDYVSHVDYWIAFLGSGYGFHDASWRYNFGGDIYTYDGSHGCVNMPLEAVAELYDKVEIGTPVFIE